MNRWSNLAVGVALLALLALDQQQVASEPEVIPQAVATAIPTAAPTIPIIEPDDWPRPTLTPTPNLGEELTAEAVARRCLRYLPLIERWNPDFDLAPDLVLAVMAQESHCLPYARDASGAANSVGLMQVIPRSWTTTEDRLEIPATNIYWGMRILYLVLNDEEHNPDHDEAAALRAYNCDWRGDDCGSRYADRVLTFWRPKIVEAMLAAGLIRATLEPNGG
jgi:soluble lytic murein transglycosylase-like protein